MPPQQTGHTQTLNYRIPGNPPTPATAKLQKIGASAFRWVVSTSPDGQDYLGYEAGDHNLWWANIVNLQNPQGGPSLIGSFMFEHHPQSVDNDGEKNSKLGFFDHEGHGFHATMVDHAHGVQMQDYVTFDVQPAPF